MTVLVGDNRYVNVVKIEDYQSKAIMVRLVLENSGVVDVPVYEDIEVIFSMKNYYTEEKK